MHPKYIQNQDRINAEVINRVYIPISGLSAVRMPNQCSFSAYFQLLPMEINCPNHRKDVID